MSLEPCDIAIVDYGLGNLYSVKHACAHVRLRAEITQSKDEILNARAVILPGIGAFGDAMETLQRLDLALVLRDYAASGRPLIGICLGMQLLMTESHEFGEHRGLNLIEGQVVPFEHPREGERLLKVPQIGWNSIHRLPGADGAAQPWDGTLLQGVADGERMYFVHSFIVRPADVSVVLSTSTYGGNTFCSALHRGNIIGCQFHPERSGREGLKIYRKLAGLITGKETSTEAVA